MKKVIVVFLLLFGWGGVAIGADEIQNFFNTRFGSKDCLGIHQTTFSSKFRLGGKYFENQKLWHFTPNLLVNAGNGFWPGIKFRIDSSGQDFFGGGFQFAKKCDDFLFFADGTLLFGEKNVVDFLVRGTYFFGNGFSYANEFQYQKIGNREALHFSPLRIGYQWEQWESLSPFVMYRPVKIAGEWEDRIYLGIDLRF